MIDNPDAKYSSTAANSAAYDDMSGCCIVAVMSESSMRKIGSERDGDVPEFEKQLNGYQSGAGK